MALEELARELVDVLALNEVGELLREVAVVRDLVLEEVRFLVDILFHALEVELLGLVLQRDELLQRSEVLREVGASSGQGGWGTWRACWRP